MIGSQAARALRATYLEAGTRTDFHSSRRHCDRGPPAIPMRAVPKQRHPSFGPTENPTRRACKPDLKTGSWGLSTRMAWLGGRGSAECVSSRTNDAKRYRFAPLLQVLRNHCVTARPASPGAQPSRLQGVLAVGRVAVTILRVGRRGVRANLSDQLLFRPRRHV